MKLVTTLTVLALALSVAPAWAQGLGVSPDGDPVVVPPKTPKERELGLEGRPPGQVEQPAPDDDMLSDVPDENLDDERLPPTPPVSPSRA
ncbi:hypothetical protein [Methylobacterium sp. Leaf117]|uniref:hypothetical protein n=1 Tax=Methylobacterium sp. Leaf117 TaxID=1736260 RepID=UPI000AD7F520|nr:hypothetical protein [Methylobacterium sp. Leaf117]